MDLKSDKTAFDMQRVSRSKIEAGRPKCKRIIQSLNLATVSIELELNCDFDPCGR